MKPAETFFNESERVPFVVTAVPPSTGEQVPSECGRTGCGRRRAGKKEVYFMGSTFLVSTIGGSQFDVCKHVDCVSFLFQSAAAEAVWWLQDMCISCGCSRRRWPLSLLSLGCMRMGKSGIKRQTMWDHNITQQENGQVDCNRWVLFQNWLLQVLADYNLCSTVSYRRNCRKQLDQLDCTSAVYAITPSFGCR